MTLDKWLALLALIFVPVGGTWGVVKLLIMRDRKQISIDVEALQKDQASLRAELSKAKEDLATLRERIRSLPDHKALQERLERLEERLEGKLDAWGDRLQASLDTALTAMRGGL